MIAVLGEDKRRASTIGIYALLFVLTNFVNKVSFKAMIACIQSFYMFYDFKKKMTSKMVGLFKR